MLAQSTKTNYQVKLEVFEGPLDLLLHLVDIAQLDICEVSLAKISTQYWEYLTLMQELNLEIESSFLVIFATLLEIKSRLLLPAESRQVLEEESSDEISQFDLVEKLKEYKKYKEAAIDLSQLERKSTLFYNRKTSINPDGTFPYIELSVFDLIWAYKKLLRRNLEAQEKNLTIEKLQISVPQRMEEIYQDLTIHQKLDFFSLFEELPSRSDIIVTFLALLELARLQKIILVQQFKHEEIYIVKK